MKYIILFPDKSTYTFKYIDVVQCKVYSVYKNTKINFFIRIFRKFIYFIGLGTFYTFYSEWTKYLNEDVQFIVFDSCKPYHRLKRVLKKARNKPIIYFWNPVKENDNIAELKKNFEVYSYSVYDSQKYDLKYNPTFFVNLPAEKTNTCEFDAIFIGKNKNRLSLLERVYCLFNNPYFYVVKDNSEVSNILELKTLRLSYEEYLNVLVRSKSVVEILFTDNADYTLRTMEALFYQKKLITNNKLIKQAVFYNPNNIFVLDECTTKQDIDNFLNKPFVKYGEEVLEYYRVESWLSRFEKCQK